MSDGKTAWIRKKIGGKRPLCKRGCGRATLNGGGVCSKCLDSITGFAKVDRRRNKHG